MLNKLGLMSLKLGLISLLFAMANAVNANCYYNGKLYPEGTAIGPYVCKGDQWIRR